MIKRILASFFVLLAMMSFAPVANAQAYGTCTYIPPINGRPGFWNCPSGVQPRVIVNSVPAVVNQPVQIIATQPMMVPQPVVLGQQVIPQGVPSGLNSCTVIGATVGGIVGNQIDNHHAGGTIAGGLLGGAIANLICSNSSGQRVTVQQPYTVLQGQTAVAASGVDPTTPGVSNVTVANIQRPQTVRVPSGCDIDGVPELQDLKGLTQAQCAAIARRLATRTTVAQQPVVASAPQKPAYCPVYGPGGALKNVVNPERRDAYCGELVRDLQTRKISWDQLQTVN